VLRWDKRASVAEWLRRQTQVLVNFVGVSSILTGCTFCLEAKLRQPGVEPGAKAWEASMLPIHHWRSSVQGRIAQSVERWSNKPLVMGSIPIVPILFPTEVL
jgi:hypothetical protein